MTQKTCPICDLDGKLTEHVARYESVLLVFSICDSCGSEQANMEQTLITRLINRGGTVSNEIVSFDVWYDLTCMHLQDRHIPFPKKDDVKIDYDDGKTHVTVMLEIVNEYNALNELTPADKRVE